MFALLFTVSLLAGAAAEASVRTCEPIKVAMCKNIGYNQTGMPNLARHTLQADADVTLQTYSPLVQYGCSTQLHLLLCAVYVPMCTDKVALGIGPCRGLCEAVHARCFPVMQGFGFSWPAELDCARFPPENNHEHMCMEGPGERGGAAGGGVAAGGTRCARLRRPNSWVWVRGAARCAPLCEAEVTWGAAQRRAAEVWQLTWGALALAGALAAAGALLGAGGGGSTERALLLAALCRGAAGAAALVRAAAGRAGAGCARDSAQPQRLLLAHDGLANPNCAVIFLLLYYFGLAASVWWVVVAGSWRASVLRPPTPALARQQRHSSLLQLAAWGVPAALTAAVLVTRDVDADELTGTCYVGNQSTKSLLALVIIPESVCLLLGVLFLISGLRAVLHRPTPVVAPPSLLNPPPPPHTRNQSILRLGAFAAMYAVISACVLATYVYEYIWRDEWLAAPVPSSEPTTQPQPAFWVFLFRIFASQILGVMIAVWVAAPRLRMLWRRVTGPQKPAPAKCPPGPPPTPLTLHCYASHPHTLSRHSQYSHKYATYRPPQQHSYRKPRHYHYSAGETIL